VKPVQRVSRWRLFWRVFNLLSILAGLVSGILWLAILIAVVDAPMWSGVIAGYLLTRYVIIVIRDYLNPR
jgi:hypothetical protein